MNQDPDNRVRAVFTHLITRLRGMNSFEGHCQAYLLIKDPADEKAATQFAQTEEQRNKLNAAIEAVRQAVAAKKSSDALPQRQGACKTPNAAKSKPLSADLQDVGDEHRQRKVFMISCLNPDSLEVM